MRSFVSVKLLAAAGAISAALTGAADAAIVSQVYSPFGGGRSYDLPYAASLGPIPVVIHGSPFAGDRDGRGVVAALQRHTSLPNLRFAPAGGSGAGGYRLVLAFGGFVPGVNYCAGRAEVPVSASAQTGQQVAASFCIGSQLHSQALVTGSPSRDPTETNFQSMMAALMTEIFR